MGIFNLRNSETASSDYEESKFSIFAIFALPSTIRYKKHFREEQTQDCRVYSAPQNETKVDSFFAKLQTIRQSFRIVIDTKQRRNLFSAKSLAA